MNFNWTILVWIAALIFVYFFGLFEGRGQGYKKRRAEEAETKKDEPVPAPVTMATLLCPAMIVFSSDRWVEGTVRPGRSAA